MIEREQVLALLRSVAEEAGVAVVMTAPDAPNRAAVPRLMSLDGGRLIKPRSEQRGTLIDFPDVGERLEPRTDSRARCSSCARSSSTTRDPAARRSARSTASR